MGLASHCVLLHGDWFDLHIPALISFIQVCGSDVWGAGAVCMLCCCSAVFGGGAGMARHAAMHTTCAAAVAAAAIVPHKAHVGSVACLLAARPPQAARGRLVEPSCPPPQPWHLLLPSKLLKRHNAETRIDSLLVRLNLSSTCTTAAGLGPHPEPAVSGVPASYGMAFQLAQS